MRNARTPSGNTVSRRDFIAVTAGVAATGWFGQEAIAQGKNATLRIGVSSFDKENLDPAIEARSAVIDSQMMLYDCIVEIGPNSELVPGIAESWSTDDSGTLWTFKIRKGVNFHGGYGEVTAEDAAFSLQRYFDPATATSSSRGPIVGAIESVTAVDKYTLQIKTKGIISGLLYLLSPHQTASGVVLSKKYLMERGGPTIAAQTKVMNERPIGSGPYEFVSRRRSQSITFKAVDKHWRVNPEIRTVQWLLIPDASTQFVMLQSGELDLIFLDPDRARQAKDVAGLKVQSFPYGLDFAMNFYGVYSENAKRFPTSDARVRRALSKAIDRKAIINTLMGGYAKLPIVPYGISSTADGVDASASKAWADELAVYDPEGAKRLLAEAGYPNGFSGIKAYTFNIAGRLTNTPELVLAIVAQWAKVGVKVDVVQLDYANIRPYMVGDMNDPYVAGQCIPFSNQPRFTLEDFLDVWYKSSGSAKLLASKDLDAMIVEIKNTVDPKKRIEIGNRALQIVRDECSSIAILSADSLYGFNTKVVGSWNPRPGYSFLARQIELIRLPA